MMNTWVRKSFAILLVFLLMVSSSALAGRSTPHVNPPNYVETKLIASDPGQGDYFGVSVAVDGDWSVVGAYKKDVSGSIDQGAVYVFRRSGATWLEQQIITAPDGFGSDYFGYSVAISADTILVGAFGDDMGGNINQGSAYVFWLDGADWVLQAKLTAADGDAQDYFGFSVALDGDTALVGSVQDDVVYSAQGSAYIFTRSGSEWSFQQKLTVSDGQQDDLFGHSVALDRNMALVSAPYDHINANVDQGSAYIFTRSGSVWSMQEKLTADDGAESDYFGWSVALDGETALIGAMYDTIEGASYQGSAYIFVHLFTWLQQAKLIASDGQASDYFGRSVALSGDTALVGAFYDAVGGNFVQGSAYIFTRDGTSWGEQKHLTASDGMSTDFFGDDVALRGNMPWVAAPGVGGGLIDGYGAVYVYAPIYQIFVPLVLRAVP